MRRRLFQVVGALALLALSGCAALNSVAVQVSTFGEWPAGRGAGKYAFDRLPSQQARDADQQRLEAAAATSLAKAGFTPAAGAETPDVRVQLGASTQRNDPQPWDDPFWWHGGWGYWRGGPWRGPAWSMSIYHPINRSYDRSVALLLRDGASGKPLYEARAVSTGYHTLDEELSRAMFEAALSDFPRPAAETRTLRVTLP
jgi:hypothetical protein